MILKSLTLLAVLFFTPMALGQTITPIGGGGLPGLGMGYSGIVRPGCPQTPAVEPACMPPTFQDRVIVDPVNGDDSTGDLNNPFLTVRNAISYLKSFVGGGVVCCLPGRYAYDTNGEDFPIFMETHVSLQGTGALDTIFDASADPTNDGDIVWDATQQTFVDGTPVISFFAPGGGCFDYTFVDGVTLVNGDEGVQIFAEEPINPQISNCFIIHNDTGIHITSTEFTPDENSPIEYHPCRPAIVFDTIAQNNIGILNDNQFTINPIIAGFNEPAVVNTYLDNNIADLEGVDYCDIVRLAFDAAKVDTAMISPRIGPLPLPTIDLGTVTVPLITNGALTSSTDYRVHLVGNQLVGQGILPIGTTSFVVPNGTVVMRDFPLGDTAYDLDCEGPGNSRIEDGQVEIGADERGNILASGFAPLSKTITAAQPLAIEGRPGDNAILYYTLEFVNVEFAAAFPSFDHGSNPVIGSLPLAGFTGFIWTDLFNNPSVQILPAFTWGSAPIILNLSAGAPFRISISEGVLNTAHLANLQTFLIN